ncbi:MAG TPA: GHMP kinase, partial [Ruminococcaceae bacterium]|nr:GHMP kinase [Oscillospiraceae bacterium]
VYGGRFSGAGFKGCCMAFLDPDKADGILANIQKQYLLSFPALAESYTACLCQTADGVSVEERD